MNLWNKLMCYSRRRSPWLFHMNSGSCNGCDIELVASLTPRYDAEQLGVRLEGSPRHADILCVTGPVTHNAVNAIKTVYGQVCGPKAVVAIGSCPATLNVFIDSRTLDGPLNKHIPVDVFVPGCPPRPDAIIRGVAQAAGILAERAAKKQIAETQAEPACACGHTGECETACAAKQATGELGIPGENAGTHPSAAKAGVDSADVLRGLKPPPPSESSLPAAGSESSFTAASKATGSEVKL